MSKKVIYIKESQLEALRELIGNEKEVTFYEFFVQTKSFLKDLLNNPLQAEPSGLFKEKGLDKNQLVSKLKDYGLIKSSERIDEVPVEEGSDKKVAKHYVQYKVPRPRFKEKVRELYNELYGKQETIQEDGATSCGSVMQGGGTNPDAGQFITPVSPVQRRKFYEPTLTRNKDEKNGSISMNRE